MIPKLHESVIISAIYEVYENRTISKKPRHLFTCKSLILFFSQNVYGLKSLRKFLNCLLSSYRNIVKKRTNFNKALFSKFIDPEFFRRIAAFETPKKNKQQLPKTTKNE